MSPPDDSPSPVDDPSTTAHTDTVEESPDVPDVPPVADWILGVFVTLAGSLFVLAGALVLLVPDRQILEAAVEADDVQVEGMTDAEFVDLMLSLLTWLGAGLVVTGLAVAVLGIAYLVHRRRVHERAARGEPTSDYLAHALLGAVVTLLTSFVPFSPVIGGGVAGYLERGDSERTISVGAASAVLLGAPFVLLGLFATIGIATGFAGIGGGEVGAMVAVLLVVGSVFSLGFSVALGAAGGWIGGKLAE